VGQAGERRVRQAERGVVRPPGVRAHRDRGARGGGVRGTPRRPSRRRVGSPVGRRGRGTPPGFSGERVQVKIPHIGWDEVTVRPGSRLFAGLGDGTRFYFVHSYAPEPDGEAVAAVCDYGGRFAAAVEHGNLSGTQFHPEKSGRAGLVLLANFVTQVRRA
jgi:Glutamine amidotransferase class-I